MANTTERHRQKKSQKRKDRQERRKLKKLAKLCDEADLEQGNPQMEPSTA